MGLRHLADAKINELINYNALLRNYMCENFDCIDNDTYRWECPALGLVATLWINGNSTMTFKLVGLYIEMGETVAREIDYRTMAFNRESVDDCIGTIENAIEECKTIIC